MARQPNSRRQRHRDQFRRPGRGRDRVPSVGPGGPGRGRQRVDPAAGPGPQPVELRDLRAERGRLLRQPVGGGGVDPATVPQERQRVGVGVGQQRGQCVVGVAERPVGLGANPAASGRRAASSASAASSGGPSAAPSPRRPRSRRSPRRTTGAWPPPPSPASPQAALCWPGPCGRSRRSRPSRLRPGRPAAARSRR